MSTKEIFGNVLVAVSFDKRVKSLIDTAVSLFHSRNFRITFAHVATQPVDAAVTSIRKRDKSIFATSIDSEILDIAKHRLVRMTSQLKSSLDFDTVTIQGFNPAETLTRYANDHNMDMIILGTTKAKGLNTAMEVIAKESKPVLIIHEDTDYMNFSERHRIVINDDLQASGQSCLEWGYTLGRILGNSRYLHCFVENEDAFEQSVREHARIPIENARQAKDAMATYKSTRKHQLERRFSEVCHINPDDLREIYDNEISVGETSMELEKAALSFQADISVFSLRRIYDREFKYEGHIPFRSMVDNDRIVMIVPP